MHAFISFKTKNFKDAISYLESKQISNIRLVEHNLNSMETMIEADVPNGVGLSAEWGWFECRIVTNFNENQ